MEPNPYVDFNKVREVNQWWMWVNHTLIPNVRVQNWYNGAPPYGLRGYLDDRVNRIIGETLPLCSWSVTWCVQGTPW